MTVLVDEMLQDETLCMHRRTLQRKLQKRPVRR